MRAQIISFHCVLKNRTGKVLSRTFNRDVLTAIDGAERLPLQGLAKGLRNLKKGEKRRIQVPAAEAYGFYDPKLVLTVARRKFDGGERCKLGDQVIHPDSDGQPRIYRVVACDAAMLTLDANHPYAGLDLVFEIEATEVRKATRKDLEEANEPPSARVAGTGTIH